jgi:ABC-type arginine transport system permease subunit
MLLLYEGQAPAAAGILTMDSSCRPLNGPTLRGIPGIALILFVYYNRTQLYYLCF